MQVGDELDMARGLALGLGAVVFGKRPAQDADRLACARRASASVRPTWASSGSVKVTRGMMRPVLAGRQPEQQRPDDQAGMIAGDMGELRRAGHDVADRVDAAVARAQPGRHRDAVAVVGDARLARGPARRRWRRGRRRRADACRRSRCGRRPSRPAPRRRSCRAVRRCATLVCSRIVTPRRAALRSTIAAISGSSPASAVAASTTVTSRAQPAIGLRQFDADRRRRR